MLLQQFCYFGGGLSITIRKKIPTLFILYFKDNNVGRLPMFILILAGKLLLAWTCFVYLD
jgi:hypothetical protein